MVGDQQFCAIPSAFELCGSQPQLSNGAGVTIDHQDFTRSHGSFKQHPDAADEVGDDFLQAEADTDRQSSSDRHHGGSVDAEIIGDNNDSHPDQAVLEDDFQGGSALLAEPEELGEETGEQSCRLSGQRDNGVTQHQGCEQFADGEHNAEHGSDREHRQSFPAAQHLKKRQDDDHENDGSQDRLIDLVNWPSWMSFLDQVFDRNQRTPEQPKTSQKAKEMSGQPQGSQEESAQEGKAWCDDSAHTNRLNSVQLFDDLVFQNQKADDQNDLQNNFAAL
ncbi:hypothetical protein [Synechococcus sp. KORDI-49]|uniref:hypothetical protein n=1 Tax=Synechococcus sp. KORDI-49 TaxID=585423 RepID=UPI003526FF8D